MAGDDHLDRETSVSAELTPSGLKAGAKSRLIAAIDRLGGNAVEWINVRMEADLSARRARIEGERQLIEAVVKYGIERIGKDEDFARRALENTFRKAIQNQANKDAVLHEAIEDLRESPPHPAENEAGGSALDDQFMDRFEYYAEGATSEQLRQKWGRVLAAEIRKPGPFLRRPYA
jgi:hypothetical protein